MTHRSEQDVFDDIFQLTRSPGYIHAIALLCFRDNYVHFGTKIKAEDMDHLYSHSRLIRTELTTLIGLLIRSDIDFAHPGIATLQSYVERTEALLSELHFVLGSPMFAGLFDSGDGSARSMDLSGPALREPIFYGGESAYVFQYRDLAEKKYGADDEWLRANVGFSIGDARKVVEAVLVVQNRTMKATQKAAHSQPLDQMTILPGFTFSANEIAEEIEIEIGKVEIVLDAFAYNRSNRNTEFTSLNAFNAVSATPLLRDTHDKYILLQQYSLVEALYETPFYWLGADKKYAPVALSNRGKFTEAFACERLVKVFGEGCVFSNVDIWKSKGEKLGEIDALVLFGNRAIVLQAKSKRLTLEARKGNDLQIKDDFKKAVQQSFDQAFSCAVALFGTGAHLTDSRGNAIHIGQPLKKIYPVCIVADHYPALSFQVQQFLEARTTTQIVAPLVTDVFALDAMTEMLESPLRLLSYLELRARFGERFMSSHELTLLGFHLKRNLWVNNDYDRVVLEDDIAADLDIAMGARRDGLPGAKMPEGIFTRMQDLPVGKIISDIESSPTASTMDLGFLLLELSEETVKSVSRGILETCKATRLDGKQHDFTVGLSTASAGITIHSNTADIYTSQQLLKNHCEQRKYAQKAGQWFGLSLRPDQSLRFGLQLKFPWEQNFVMDQLTAGLSQVDTWHAPSCKTGVAKKLGRNELCHCGSQKKYKKCCLGLSK